MAEAALQAEAALRDGRAPLEDSETGSRGQLSTGKALLHGKQMVLNESEEHDVQYNDWLRQKKASNTKLTLTTESSRSELASEEAFATSDMFVALI